MLCMIPYQSIEQAFEFANHTPYGLSSAVFAKDDISAINIAKKYAPDNTWSTATNLTIYTRLAVINNPVMAESSPPWLLKNFLKPKR